MKENATKKNLKELKNRKINEELLEKVSGGGDDLFSSSNLVQHCDDAKKYHGGFSKKK